MKSLLYQILTREKEEPLVQEQLDIYLTEDDRIKICKVLDTINPYKLFDSMIHGQNHSEKVFLFGYILIQQIRKERLFFLSERDIEILYIALIYHDNARSSDYEDTIHGYSSALRIEEIVNLGEFSESDKELLRAIIDAHSIRDSDFENKIIPAYELEGQEEKFYNLIKILKDADALDRKRLLMNSGSDLDPSYFRIPFSKELIDLSEALNLYFKNVLLSPKNNRQEVHGREGYCLHCIGFDFFKLPLILKKGVLSKNQMLAEGIQVPRNFDGVNLKDWISVIALEDFHEENTAYREFARHGINLLCHPERIVEGDPKLGLEKSIQKGLPYTNGNYEDERYIYKEILPNEIKAIVLLNDNLDKDIKTLSYIYATPSADRLLKKIHYYQKKTETENLDENLRRRYREYREFFRKANQEAIDSALKNDSLFLQVVMTTCEDINDYLQEMVYDYYKRKLYPEKEEDVLITVRDVITYELEKSYHLEFIDLETEHCIYLEPKKVLNLSKRKKKINLRKQS